MALSKKTRLAVTGVGAALAFGLAVPAVAFAEDATPAPTASASATAGTDATPGTDANTTREQKQTERREALAAGLAKELGISQDKVTAALEKVETSLEADAKADRQAALKSRLDQAVKDGKLTQEQADAILKASDAGVLLGGGGRGGPGGH